MARSVQIRHGPATVITLRRLSQVPAYVLKLYPRVMEIVSKLCRKGKYALISL